ncbi:hypothetical protein M2140_000379 [Clostridiales Family XIII bacterium PM5-7]
MRTVKYGYLGIITLGLAEYTGVIRIKDGIFEQFLPRKNEWVENVDSAKIYEGSPETDPLDESEARKLEEKLRCLYN